VPLVLPERQRPRRHRKVSPRRRRGGDAAAAAAAMRRRCGGGGRSRGGRRPGGGPAAGGWAGGGAAPALRGAICCGRGGMAPAPRDERARIPAPPPSTPPPAPARFTERDGRWHHLAVTWTAADNGLTEVYWDGLITATAFTGKTAPLDPHGALMLGGEQARWAPGGGPRRPNTRGCCLGCLGREHQPTPGRPRAGSRRDEGPRTACKPAEDDFAGPPCPRARALRTALAAARTRPRGFTGPWTRSACGARAAARQTSCATCGRARGSRATPTSSLTGAGSRARGLGGSRGGVHAGRPGARRDARAPRV
jgi:hypothetical protein